MTKNEPLKILIIEDNGDDAELILREFTKGHYFFVHHRVESETQLQEALTQRWDVILSDYNLPGFSALRALEILKSQSLDLPFIIISGAVGEETAVEAMRAGAHDFVQKGKLARLLPAVERELRESHSRQAAKRAERALQQSEARFRRLIESNIIGVIFFRYSGEIVDANNAFLSMLGYTKDDLHKGLINWRKMTPPQWDEADRKGWVELKARGYLTPFEKEYYHRDGHPVPIFLGGTLFEDSQEEGVAFVVDLTERKKVEVERSNLLASEQAAKAEILVEQQRLKTVFMQIPEVVSVLRGPNHIYDMVNPASKDLTGGAEILGRPAWDVLPEESRDFFVKLFDEVYQTGEPKFLTEFEFKGYSQVLQKEVSGFFNTSVIPMRNSSKQIDGLICYSVDVTAHVESRRRVENLVAELTKQQSWLESILDLMPVPLALLEPNSARIIFANKASDKLFGGNTPHPANEAEYAESIVCYYEDGRRVPVNDIPAIRAARGERLNGLQIYWQTTKGRVPLIVFSDVIPSMAGHEQTIILMYQDISKLKRTEENLQRAVRVRDEFLATLSHELRTPMNVIIGWVHFMRMQGFDTKELPQILDTLERNSKVQVQLIEDLLDVSRIISGKLNMEIASVKLGDVIRAGVESVNLAAQAKDIRISYSETGEDIRILGDANRLQQVLWNLLSNAIKFTPRGGRVDVDLAKSESKVILSVKDHGQGIDPDFLPYVFERFRQEDSSTTRHTGGLGLGLAIVRHIVELHGGQVDVTSEGKGKGATFFVALPLQIHSQPKPTPTAGLDLPQSTFSIQRHSGELQGLSILVVDDIPDVRELLSKVLSVQGALVSEAATASEAFHALNSFNYDILISDIGMPNEDGYSLIRKVRAMEKEVGRKTVPAIALTAYARREEQILALQEGFQVHLSKPVDPGELIKTVVELAETRL